MKIVLSDGYVIKNVADVTLGQLKWAMRDADDEKDVEDKASIEIRIEVKEDEISFEDIKNHSEGFNNFTLYYGDLEKVFEGFELNEKSINQSFRNESSVIYFQLQSI